MFEAIAEALYFAVDTLYMNLFEMLLTHWEESAAAMNSGQQTIYGWHLQFAVEDWLNEAQDYWPDADADWYVDYCYSSYDMDVLERAFSDTIHAPVDDMWDMIYRAQELYETAQMFEAMAFL